jgi:hypothetical protein
MSIRRTFARLSAVTFLLLMGSHASIAQRIEPVAAFSHSVSTDAAPRQSMQVERTKGPFLTWGGIGGAIVGAPIGAFAGMLAGVAFAHIGTCNGSECSFGAGLAGLAVGEAIGVPLGAHIGSHGRGNLAASVLTSAAIAGTGALILRHPSTASPAVAVAIPVLQLVSVLAFER